MPTVSMRFTLGGLLALALAAVAQQQGAEDMPPALAADDECSAETGEQCGLSALQRKLEARRLGAAGDSAHAGSCMNYGCSAYVYLQLCQCNPQCREHNNCCDDFDDTCGGARHLSGTGDGRGPTMTLYHQTSPDIGELILKNGFKPGTRGWCGGAMYFATSPQATVTKALGLDSHRGFLIEAEVFLGKVKQMPPWCDMKMTAEKLHKEGYDSVVFNPIDGDEHVIYNSSQVLATRRFPVSSPR
uniref:SMB domain-containing protein n=1 Tax=Alexandrium catenella TaxID=2925 RepID=A0A7S1RPY7_ALECA|mmetsp:Transcript_68264/g.181684  ORF Transcript_68264/g.181684 Transcript_68264/m.181684 type:complete len:244 (+) Transcript_68264:64-795(+)